MIRNIWVKFKHSLFQDKCYDEMEKKGDAIFNCCCGMTDDNGLINHNCLKCKYLTI